MNRMIKVRLAVLIAVAVALGQAEARPDLYETTVLGHGATHYWRLGEAPGSTTAVNRANPGTNDGTYTGTYTLGQAGALSGSGNTAFHVDGTGAGYVSVGNLGATPAQGTIEFWMYPDVVEDYRNPFSTAGAVGATIGNEGFRFEENSSGQFRIQVGNDGGANSQGYSTAANTLTAGQWYHIVATWDSAPSLNTVQLYLNGNKLIDSTFAHNFATNLGNVEIGRGFSTGAERRWKGLVDEVAIYSTALDATKVQLHYDIGIGVVRDDVISANFASGHSGLTYSMNADMVAGVVPVKHWNNLTGANNSSGVTLNDATGNATTATIAWTCNGTFHTDINQNLSGDHMMMKAHLDARSPTDATVTVSNLPDAITAGGYDVYVYFDAVTSDGSVTSGYTIGDQSYWTKDTSTFDGLYVQATGTTKETATWGSNYAHFRNLTESSFTLIADSDTFRAEISGIQIVGVPEPSSMMLAGLGLLVLLGLRWRKRG